MIKIGLPVPYNSENAELSSLLMISSEMKELFKALETPQMPELSSTQKVNAIYRTAALKGLPPYALDNNITIHLDANENIYPPQPIIKPEDAALADMAIKAAKDKADLNDLIAKAADAKKE